jgi:RecB family exonuclease
MLESAGGTCGESAAQGIGTLVHALAQQAADERLDAEELLDRFSAAVDRLDLGRGWFAGRQRERAEQMVRRLADWLQANSRQAVAAEKSFEVEVGRAILKGQVDRLELDGRGRLVVVDLKTGKTGPKTADLATNSQLGAYQLAVSEGAFDDLVPGSRESGGAELVQLGIKDAKKFRVDRQPALDDALDPDWALHMVETSAVGMAGSVFDALENNLCRACPVRTSCPLQDDGRQVTA